MSEPVSSGTNVIKQLLELSTLVTDGVGLAHFLHDILWNSRPP